MQKYNQYKKQNQKDQRTIKSFDNLYWRSLQDNFFDKNEYESRYSIFDAYADEKKMYFFSKWEQKTKIKSVKL